MNYSDYALGKYSYPKDIEEKRTATKMKLMEMEYAAKMLATQRAAEESARNRPQNAMDEFLGGVPYEKVLELVKQQYPEKFI